MWLRRELCYSKGLALSTRTGFRAIRREIDQQHILNPMSANKVRAVLKELANPEIAGHSRRFFKTGRGEYGEGDQFLGIRVPVIRKQLSQFKDLPIGHTLELLKSPWHEERLFALLLLVHQFVKADQENQTTIFNLYLANTKYINNWDLVDSSAAQIVGSFLQNKDRQILYDLAKSPCLWERRIAVMATLHFIRLSDFDDTLALCELLINDQHDLIHKASGWMLREIGKRQIEVEKTFLAKHYKAMPRTMLRYAIERFPEAERKAYLQGVL